RLPFRMLVGSGLHAVDGESELGVDRLLDPQRAVIVDGGDAFGRRHIVWPAVLGHRRDEVENGFLGRSVVPRWEGVGALWLGMRAAPDRADKPDGEER